MSVILLMRCDRCGIQKTAFEPFGFTIDECVSAAGLTREDIEERHFCSECMIILKQLRKKGAA